MNVFHKHIGINYCMQKKPKQSTALWAILLLLLSPLFTLAQDEQKFSVDFPQQSLSQSLKQLQEKTGIIFAYDEQQLKGVMTGPLHFQAAPLREIMEKLMQGTGYEYRPVNGTIVISRHIGKPAVPLPPRGTIRGRIVDFETSQRLPGATVTLQETGQSVLADDKGYYVFKNITDTTYTLTVSYAGYQKNYIPGVAARAGKTNAMDVKMQTGSSLGEVVVQAGARKVKAVTHSTDKQLLQEIRNATGSVSGISSEAINRTADRNAGEVMKRISGVTVVDNRFVVVRGMNERYNLTYLNDNIAPSTELYTRAFAYDLLPSSIIDKILVYKSPRADLNGQFAGAAIKVFTKNAMPVRHFDIGVQVAHRPGSTMTTVNTYSGGKLDWLGVDDGTRKLPSWSPGVFQTTKAAQNISQAEMVKSFSSTLDYGQMQSTPDMQVYANYYNAWHIGHKVRLYDLTSVTYTKETTSYDQHRQTGNTDAYEVDPNSAGNNLNLTNTIGDYQQTTEIGKVNVLENLTLKLGSHNTLQLKNFFVNDGRVFTGINNYQLNALPHFDTASYFIRHKDIYLSFQQRTLYSGNLGGVHDWGMAHPQGLEWNLGYTHDLQNVPDQRISHFRSDPSLDITRSGESPALAYTAVGTNSNSPDDGFEGMIDRIFIKNKEDVYNFSADYTLHLGRDVQVKAGTFQLFKDREVGRRTFRVDRGGLTSDQYVETGQPGANDGWVQNYGMSNWNLLHFRLQDLGTVWNPANFAQDGSGLWINDITTPADGYAATEQNNAGYVMGDWKTADEKLTLNGGYGWNTTGSDLGLRPKDLTHHYSPYIRIISRLPTCLP